MRRILLTGAVGAILLAPVMAAGQSSAGQTLTPAAAIQARQGQFREIGTAYKAINDELRKPAPGKFIMTSSARQIAANLRQVGRMFPQGSGPSSHIKTKALPTIWANQAEFSKMNAAAIAEADKLVVALRGTDTSAITAQARTLGRTCQTCHNQFRLED